MRQVSQHRGLQSCHYSDEFGAPILPVWHSDQCLTAGSVRFDLLVINRIVMGGCLDDGMTIKGALAVGVKEVSASLRAKTPGLDAVAASPPCFYVDFEFHKSNGIKCIYG